MATSCKELTHWKRLWYLEGLGTEGEEDVRGWDGWMASLIRWMWVWVNSRSWWWTGRPGVLWFMGLQRVGHDWATDLIWSDLRTRVLKSDAGVWILAQFLSGYVILGKLINLSIPKSPVSNLRMIAVPILSVWSIHYNNIGNMLQ